AFAALHQECARFAGRIKRRNRRLRKYITLSARSRNIEQIFCALAQFYVFLHCNITRWRV
ncbi:MAG: hypothetical protein OXC10_05965, partial [Rhodospirillaceae bacterium]|nr:hypothetical protein [Rhodospirillaceae bacterium]